jgi:hypothetical protein
VAEPVELVPVELVPDVPELLSDCRLSSSVLRSEMTFFAALSMLLVLELEVELVEPVFAVLAAVLLVPALVDCWDRLSRKSCQRWEAPPPMDVTDKGFSCT